MTLIVAIHGRETIWLLADRRLSYGGGRPPIDDAIKVVDLHTTDGVGLLAYAGLGATARGTQPSDWLSGVLRGRGGIGFEQALSFVADAANRELPRHLAWMPYALNNIVIPARIYGRGPRMYSIDNELDSTGAHVFRYTRNQIAPAASARIALRGSGANYVATRGASEFRDLLNLIRANDHGRVSDRTVSDRFAQLNWRAHQATLDKSVGPRSVVLWRRWAGSRLNAAGGGQQFYTGLDRESEDIAIPSIANGMDVRSIMDATKQVALPELIRALRAGEQPHIDEDAMQRLVAERPYEPDDSLK